MTENFAQQLFSDIRDLELRSWSFNQEAFCVLNPAVVQESY